MRYLLTLLLVAYVLPASAQFVEVHPESVGMSSERLERLDAVIQREIDAERIAGVISLILRDGKAAHYKSYGMMNKEEGIPMPKDAILRIASMSKAVTSVAVMMLYEEGHFSLNDPVHKFIPEFKDAVVAVEDGDGFKTVPADRPISIRHLLTHTAGLTYGAGLANEDYEKASLTGWYFADKDETIGSAIKRLASLPLHAHPGDRWQYGYSTDVLGYFVEVVSGMPLDRFFEDRIFEPLGMQDSHFFLPPEKAERFAPVYGIGESGELELLESTEETDYIHGPRMCFSGGAGLLSTATDYGRFLQMLLNGGELDGIQLLSPKTIELMRADHIDDLEGWGENGFGLGFWVVEDLGIHGELSSEGAYGWGSAYYPIYWIDPAERMIGMIMTQLRPAGGLDLNQRYQRMAYQAIVKSFSE